jgi:hypothetical protein
MTKENLEVVADWMLVVGALALFASLFLTWSHQFPPSLNGVVVLQGVPSDPTAWQVYSAADVVLAVVAASLFAVAMYGTRVIRALAFGMSFATLVFVLHALASPPTNGIGGLTTANVAPDYALPPAGAGIGETVALIALALAIVGLATSFTAD